MGLKCQIKRNAEGAVQEVLAYNEKPSKLYESIKEINPSFTELESIREYAKFYTPAFRNKFGDFTKGESTLLIDDNGEPIYSQEALSRFRLSTKLESGFLKDFNISIHEWNAIHNHVKLNSNVADFVGKIIAVNDTTDITNEAMFFAYMMLGKENGKLKSELKQVIRAWNKYDEKYEFYKEQITNQYGFIPGKDVFKNKVRDQIIIDFLTEELVNYYNNPKAFEEKGKEAWTKEEVEYFNPKTVIGQVIKWIRDYFKKLLDSETVLEKNIRLSNLAANIAHEMINREYRMYEYNLSPDQIQTYYEETIASDDKASNIIDTARKLGLWLTGSLALRAQGNIYRTPDELIHDLDFIIPYELMLSQPEIFDELLVGKEGDMFANFVPFTVRVLNAIKKYDWYNSFVESHPDFTIINAFQDPRSLDTVTIQGVIEGEYYESKGYHFEDGKKVKHDKGQWIKGSGYFIDFFVKVTPTQTLEKNSFTHWRTIFAAKLMFGRAKDLVDYIRFTTFEQDPYNFDISNPSFAYTRDLSGQKVHSSETTFNVKDVDEGRESISEYDEGYDYHNMDIESWDSPLLEKFDLTNHNDLVVQNILQQVSNIMNTEYEYVTPVEARYITQDSLNPWSGQPAFYYGDKVYFVSENINAETVLHEFSHPFVRHIKNVNRPLFDKLFTDAIKTEEGQEILAESIKEYEEVIQEESIPDIVKEEVIVKSLTKAAMAIKLEEPTTKKFDSFIQKLLYHVKQAIRKLFGSKIKIEKLSVNTSLEELAKILTGSDKININKEFVTDSDIVAYQQSLIDINKDLEKLYIDKEEELGIFVDKQFEAIKSLYNTLKSTSKEFGDIKRILVTDENTGLINDMMKLKYFTTEQEIDPNRKEVLKDMDHINYVHQKVSALSRNFLLMYAMLTKINEYMQMAVKDPDQMTVLKDIRHFDSLIQSWDKWLTATRNILQRENIPQDSSLMKHISELKGLSESINSYIKDIMTEAVSDAVVLMTPINEVLEFSYNKEKERLEKLIKNSSGSVKEAYQRMLDEEKYKYEISRLDSDTVKAYLSGAARNDNSLINAWFVNYIGNPDPIVGSFGKYLKDHYTKAQTNAFKKAHLFRTTMDELMKKVGYDYNATRLDKLFNDVTFLDKTGYIESGQEFSVKEYPAYRIGYKDYDAVYVRYEFDIQKAHTNWVNTKDNQYKKEYEQLILDRDAHLELFFQRPYHDIVYKIDDQLLNDVRTVKDKPFEAGKEGKKKVDAILKELEDHDITEKVDDPLLYLESLEERAEIFRRYSALFKERDEYGNIKEDEELAIAQALKDHRERKKEYYEWKEIEGAFENALRGIEVKIEQKLTLDKENGGEGLEKNSDEYRERFEEERNKYLNANKRTKLKDSFYELRGNLLAKISEVFQKIEADRIAKSKQKGIPYKPLVRFDTIIKDINDVMSGNRDDDGQPIATDMTDEAIRFIKDKQEEMVEAKKEFAKLNGLNQAQFDELQNLWSIIKSKKKLTNAQQIRFDELRNIQDALGAEDIYKDMLISYWRQLEDLQSTVPTEYYIEIADSFYQDIIRDELDETAPLNMNEEFAEYLLDPEFIDSFLEKDENFKTWFNNNHILTTKFIEGIGSIPYYERVKVWNVIKPNDPSYYETTTLSDGEVIDGVPTLKFYRRNIKPVHTDKNGKQTILITGYNPKTKEIELKTDVHKDGTGRWLPLPLEVMERKRAENPNLFTDVRHDKYIDRDYLKMKKDNTPAYQVLEKLKEFVHEFEKDLDSSKKMGHRMARYRKTGYDHVITGNPTQKVANVWNAFRDLWRTTKDNADEGINFEDDWKYTSNLSGIFAPDEGQIPISGRFAIDEKQVSPDIMKSIMLRMSSIELYKSLDEAHPLAKGFNKLINELNPADVATAVTNLQRRVSKIGDYDDLKLTKEQKELRDRISNIQFGDPATIEGNKKKRQKAVNAIYEVWWEGKAMANLGKTAENQNKKTVQHKAVNNMLKMASHRFFALDIQSAFKNFFGAQFQIGTEALLGRKYYNPITKKEEHLLDYNSYIAGRGDAKLAGIMLSKDIYTRGAQSLFTQLIYLFDAVEGMTEIGTESRIATSFSRSFASDVASMSWLTTHRKYLENNVTLSMFFGAMNHIKVEQKTKTGVKKIKYKNAWELNPETGMIQLKEGIDKSYDINGKMFNLYKNRIHEVNSFNQGMYSKMNSPMANRYLLYRAFISMRKFFLKMFLNRHGYSNEFGGSYFKPSTWKYMSEKWDPALQDFHMGYVSRTLRTIGRIADTSGDYFLHMTRDEKVAAMRTLWAPIKSYLFMMLGFWLFGLWDYDEEDPDRWKKLKERSGPLPIPFFVDKKYLEEYPFKPMGWVKNQALAIILQTNQENRYFQLTPGSLKAQLNTFDNTSIANTVIFGDALQAGEFFINSMFGNKEAFYQKRQGAMRYLQPGEAKYWKILYNMMGVKGKNADPVTTLKISEQYLPKTRIQKGPIRGILGY